MAQPYVPCPAGAAMERISTTLGENVNQGSDFNSVATIAGPIASSYQVEYKRINDE